MLLSTLTTWRPHQARCDHPRVGYCLHVNTLPTHDLSFPSHDLPLPTHDLPLRWLDHQASVSQTLRDAEARVLRWQREAEAKLRENDDKNVLGMRTCKTVPCITPESLPASSTRGDWRPRMAGASAVCGWTGLVDANDAEDDLGEDASIVPPLAPVGTFKVMWACTYAACSLCISYRWSFLPVTAGFSNKRGRPRPRAVLGHAHIGCSQLHDSR